MGWSFFLFPCAATCCSCFIPAPHPSAKVRYSQTSLSPQRLRTVGCIRTAFDAHAGSTQLPGPTEGDQTFKMDRVVSCLQQSQVSELPFCLLCLWLELATRLRSALPSRRSGQRQPAGHTVDQPAFSQPSHAAYSLFLPPSHASWLLVAEPVSPTRADPTPVFGQAGGTWGQSSLSDKCSDLWKSF